MNTSQIKRLSLIIFSLVAIIITAFAGTLYTGIQEIDLLRNEQHKEQAFNQILNENQLFSEFMKRVTDHPDGMKMMRENMMQMMEERPAMKEGMMENMMQMMEEHPSMREEMMEMMREHGHMHHQNDHHYLIPLFCRIQNPLPVKALRLKQSF